MTAKEQREARLAAQLRANLRRRKVAPVEVEQQEGGSGTPAQGQGDEGS